MNFLLHIFTDRLIKKPPKKIKHHHSSSYKMNSNRKHGHAPSKTWLKNIPTNVLNFPQHFPTHFLDEKENDEDDDNYADSTINNEHLNKKKEIETKIETAQTPPKSTTTLIKSDIPENVLSGSSNMAQSKDIKKGANSSKDDTTIDTSKLNAHQTSSSFSPTNKNDKLRIITTNPIIIDNKNTEDIRSSSSRSSSNIGSIKTDDNGSIITNSDSANDSGYVGGVEEKGYYEKTIINKNGVFIENIRKIGNIDENQNKIATSEMHVHQEQQQQQQPEQQQNEETINRKNYELMNVPLSQHYVITSSGKIEKTDTLASDDVIAQFREGLNDYQQQPPPPPSPSQQLQQHSGTSLTTSHYTMDPTNKNINNITTVMAIPTLSTSITLSASESATGGYTAGASTSIDAKPQFNCIVMGKCHFIK